MASQPGEKAVTEVATPTPTKPTTTTTTTSTSTGRMSAGLQHVQGRNSTPDRRHFAVSTDDAAIFLEDTIDRATAQCIATSPSALAILSPQRMPSSNTHVDVTDYDPSHIGGGGFSASVKKGRHSGLLAGGGDTSSSHGVRLSFGKSPTPKAARKSGSQARVGGAAPQETSIARSTPPKEAAVSSCSSLVRRRLSGTPSPAAARPQSCGMPLSDEEEATPHEPVVPLHEWERVERERNRFEKMYEHQKALYEDMAEKHAEVHANLQEKIVEVVALSTRNEESKKFIRQLKREMTESRTRVMDIQNRALEEARAERDAKSRYENLIEEHEHKYRRTLERHETKMAGMESLLKDLTCMRNEHDRVHVSQLDALLKAAYAKSTALFSDLLRQSRQVDLLYDAKDDLEKQVDQLRREKREAEATLAEERRRMMYESERFIEQIEEQQQSILNLRQMLIRALATADEDDDPQDEVDEYADVYMTRRAAYRHRLSSDDEEAERDEDVGTAGSRSSENAVGGDREVCEADGGPGGSATPLRYLRGTVVKDRGSIDNGSNEVDREPRSNSEERTLDYLRAQIVNSLKKAADVGDKQKSDSDKPPLRPSVPTVVKASASSASASLSSNAVIAVQSGHSEPESRPSIGEDSIFKPPKHRASGSGGGNRGKDAAAGGRGEETDSAPSSSSKRVVHTAAVSKAPTLRERDAVKPSGKSSPASESEGNGTTPAATPHRWAEVHHVEPYRIPRRGATTDSSEADREKAPGVAKSAATPTAGTRKRLDFAAALSSASAKRDEEKAREQSVNAADKENRASARPTVVRSAAVKPHPHSSQDSGERDDSDNDDVPRLVPKQTQLRPILRTISQTVTERSSGSK